MPFASTLDCCTRSRTPTLLAGMAQLKALLGTLQNLVGADTVNDPAIWDTRHTTLEKIARAMGNTFSDCCRLETNYALSTLIDDGISNGVGGIPAGALLDEDGNPILDENGDYIISARYKHG